jgi:hypothetical protein
MVGWSSGDRVSSVDTIRNSPEPTSHVPIPRGDRAERKQRTKLDTAKRPKSSASRSPPYWRVPCVQRRGWIGRSKMNRSARRHASGQNTKSAISLGVTVSFSMWLL